MGSISRSEFERLCEGIREDGESIYRHNPIGTREETLLWMLMSCLATYLSLADSEIPCFPGRPTAETYRDAIRFMIRGRQKDNFEIESLMDSVVEQ